MGERMRDLSAYLSRPIEFYPDNRVRALRLEVPGTDEITLVTFSNQGHRQLLVPQPEGAEKVDRHLSKFIQAHTQPYSDRETGTVRDYLVVTCTSGPLRTTFESLITQYISQLDDIEHNALQTFWDVYLDWKKLLQQKQEEISETTLIGLFGELLILERLAKNDPVLAVEAWSGPDNNGPDFKTLNFNIEVKTTTRTNHKILRVDSPLQFTPQAGMPLFLARVALSEQPDGITLAQLQDRLKELSVSSWDLSAKVQNVSHYLFTNFDHKRRYKVVSMDFYRVNDSFPHIIDFTRDSLKPGVQNLHYDVNLNFAEQLSDPEVDDLFHQLESNNE